MRAGKNWRFCVGFTHSILDTRMRIAKVAALDNNSAQACSSVGEHHLDTVGVGGSIPPMPTIKNRTLRGSCSTPAIERHRAKPASAHAIKNRTLGGSCSTPAIERRRAKPASAHHAAYVVRRGGETRAIHSAECYSPQPLLPQCPLSTLLRSAASTSVSGGYPRSETMNRE